ncbi:MAG TPA: pyridoxamine 5'-phosphate oxidase family protein [Stellaceae bacterium]|nr:pyridoxamine 5'-phosphate oxidase family protein [Stellaceae bacterium]
MIDRSCGGSPFHPGERAIQQRVGVRDKMEAVGRRVLRDFMPDQHREFFALLPFLVLGSVDDAGWPAASIVTGTPGFASTPDATTLRIRALPLPSDAASANLRPGSDIGVVGIDFATRRRNRANGTVTAIDDGGFDVRVMQSFGNCPKYIQARDWRAATDDERGPLQIEEGGTLGAAERAMIAAADTFFIASALGHGDEPGCGVDASHRGGLPGFVRSDDERTLTAPDFSGNLYFNTLGNLLLNQRSGLLFVDFTGGTTLQVWAEAEIVWDGPEVAAVAGAQRLVRFHVARWRRSRNAVPLRWRFRGYSPFLERSA